MSYLRTWSPTGADRDLIVVFPPAGSGCLRLGECGVPQSADRVVAGVQLPGREDRLAEPMPAFDEAVTAIAEEVRTLPRRRLGLLGISLGGLLAFRVAVALERAGIPVSEAWVVAARAPEFWRDYQADPPAAEVDAMLGAGWNSSSAGTYAAEVLYRDLRMAAGYDIGKLALRHAALRSVSGRRDLVTTEAQMRNWQMRSAHYLGHLVLDADHQAFTGTDVLSFIVSEMLSSGLVSEGTC